MESLGFDLRREASLKTLTIKKRRGSGLAIDQINV